MRNFSFSPFKFIVIGFLSLFVIRLSMVIADIPFFEAQAEEKDLTKAMQKATGGEPSSDKKKKKEVDDSDPDKENIQQKLTKPSDKNDKGKDFNPYAFEEVKTLIESDAKSACITGTILVSAKERLEFLEKREEALKEQQRLVEIADRRVREQVAKLELIKDKIVEQAQLADSKIAKESRRLISIYEKMKPKDAANIFNEMSPKVAAELLRSMREDQSSAILAKMSPKIAYDVTLALAGNIKDTKKEYDDLKN